MYQKCIKLEITTILTDDKEVPWKYSDKKAAFFDYTEVNLQAKLGNICFTVARISP